MISILNAAEPVPDPIKLSLLFKTGHSETKEDRAAAAQTTPRQRFTVGHDPPYKELKGKAGSLVYQAWFC